MTEIPKEPMNSEKNPTNNPWESLGDGLVIAGFEENGRPVFAVAKGVDSSPEAVVPVRQDVVPAGDRVVVPISKENVTPQMLRQGHNVTSDGVAYPIRPIK